MENNFIIGEAGYFLLGLEPEIKASEEKVKIGKMLSSYMKENSLTKKDISIKTGLSVYKITKILRGFHDMKLSEKHLIQVKLNISL
jgi:hypothetical protein